MCALFNLSESTDLIHSIHERICLALWMFIVYVWLAMMFVEVQDYTKTFLEATFIVLVNEPTCSQAHSTRYLSRIRYAISAVFNRWLSLYMFLRIFFCYPKGKVIRMQYFHTCCSLSLSFSFSLSLFVYFISKILNSVVV